MKKHLYFVCPTDHLETVINKTFKQENYFCTSLGNSITFDTDVMAHINELLETKEITEITFILSDNNHLFMNALMNQDFSDIVELNNFYSEIIRQKEFSKTLWKLRNLQIPILSNYLMMRIKDLQPKISSWMIDRIKVSGKIYNSRENFFLEVHADLFTRKYLSLN